MDLLNMTNRDQIENFYKKVRGTVYLQKMQNFCTISSKLRQLGQKPHTKRGM